MSKQLPLSISLNEEIQLIDFIWGQNTIIQNLINSLFMPSPKEHFIYLYGDNGIGKSHLLQGICQTANQQNLSALYLPLDTISHFPTEILEGVEQNSIIALDAFDAIAGKAEWERAVFHLYNKIKDNQNSILIIAGCATPNHIGIELQDLQSRLNHMLVMKLLPLSDEDKLIWLKQLAQKRGLDLSAHTGEYLLSHCSRDMSTLINILNLLDTASLAHQRRLTIPFIKTIISTNA